MQNEIDAMDAVSRAVDRITRHGRFLDFTLSNGIVLTMKPVPPLLLNAVIQEFKTPPPPKFMNEEKGREEDNPNDPAYQKTLEELAAKQELATNSLLLSMGTSFKSAPEGYFKPEDEGWVDLVKFNFSVTGQNVEIDTDDKIKRYLCWLRYYAMETTADVVLCNHLPNQLAGIREGEIEEVLEFFRRISERGANPESPVEIGSQNGNTNNRAARRASARARGA